MSRTVPRNNRRYSFTCFIGFYDWNAFFSLCDNGVYGYLLISIIIQPAVGLKVGFDIAVVGTSHKLCISLKVNVNANCKVLGRSQKKILIQQNADRIIRESNNAI